MGWDGEFWPASGFGSCAPIHMCSASRNTCEHLNASKDMKHVNIFLRVAKSMNSMMLYEIISKDQRSSSCDFFCISRTFWNMRPWWMVSGSLATHFLFAKFLPPRVLESECSSSSTVAQQPTWKETFASVRRPRLARRFQGNPHLQLTNPGVIIKTPWRCQLLGLFIFLYMIFNGAYWKVIRKPQWILEVSGSY